jgi:hypothetical protein
MERGAALAERGWDLVFGPPKLVQKKWPSALLLGSFS